LRRLQGFDPLRPVFDTPARRARREFPTTLTGRCFAAPRDPGAALSRRGRHRRAAPRAPDPTDGSPDSRAHPIRRIVSASRSAFLCYRPLAGIQWVIEKCGGT